MKNFEKSSFTPEATEKKEPTFQICRDHGCDFEVYETMVGKEAAIEAYTRAIQTVASPSEIGIYEVGKGLRRDLIEEVSNSLEENQKKPEDITLDDKISMDTAKKLGLTFFRSTDAYDYFGQPMSLNEMAEAQANSVVDAKKRRLQTSIDPNTGWWVSWNKPESELAKQYYKRVEEIVEKIEKEEQE